MYVEGRQLPQVLEKIYDVKCYINKQIFVYKSMRYKDILILNMWTELLCL